MALGVSEGHLELAASVRGWAGRHCGPGVIRAAAESGGAESPRPDPSLLGLHLPEESGGQGYGLSELAVALEELGDALVPGGFLPTVLASALLARSGPAGAGPAGSGPARPGPAGADLPKLLAGLADGSLSGAVALAAGVTRTATGGGLMLDGESVPVLGGGLADLV